MSDDLRVGAGRGCPASHAACLLVHEPTWAFALTPVSCASPGEWRMLRMSRCTQAPARQPLVRAGTGPSWLAGSVEFLPWAPGNGTGQTGGVCLSARGLRLPVTAAVCRPMELKRHLTLNQSKLTSPRAARGPGCRAFRTWPAPANGPPASESRPRRHWRPRPAPGAGGAFAPSRGRGRPGARSGWQP